MSAVVQLYICGHAEIKDAACAFENHGTVQMSTVKIRGYFKEGCEKKNWGETKKNKKTQ